MVNARLKPTACALALAVAAAGCASTEEAAVLQSFTRAQSSIDAAQESGAYEHGSIPLNRAREKLQEARAAAQEGDEERADRLAEEAVLDAELAEAMASNQEAQSALQELSSTIQTLRDEIARGQSSRSGPQANQ